MKLNACFEDGGDCTDFITKYPDCNVPMPGLVANGFCDGFPYFSKDCGNDGGECFKGIFMPNSQNIFSRLTILYFPLRRLSILQCAQSGLYW